MAININLFDDKNIKEALARIEQKLGILENRIMSLAEDLQAKLVELNEAITDVADDITKLLATVVPSGGLTEAEATQLLADLSSKVTALKSVASQYPTA